MRHEFTAVFEAQEDWIVALSEVPGANGQGRTKEEARKSLADAIVLILKTAATTGYAGPRDAEREVISVDVHET